MTWFIWIAAAFVWMGVTVGIGMWVGDLLRRRGRALIAEESLKSEREH